MDLFEVLAVISDWLYASAYKNMILLRSACISCRAAFHGVGLSVFKGILSHRNIRVKSNLFRRKRGRYQRRWRPFAKLSRLFRGWFLDALVILGGSAVLAVMFLSLAGF